MLTSVIRRARADRAAAGHLSGDGHADGGALARRQRPAALAGALPAMAAAGARAGARPPPAAQLGPRAAASPAAARGTGLFNAGLNMPAGCSTYCHAATPPGLPSAQRAPAPWWTEQVSAHVCDQRHAEAPVYPRCAATGGVRVRACCRGTRSTSLRPRHRCCPAQNGCGANPMPHNLTPVLLPRAARRPAPGGRGREPARAAARVRPRAAHLRAPRAAAPLLCRPARGRGRGAGGAGLRIGARGGRERGGGPCRGGGGLRGGGRAHVSGRRAAAHEGLYA